jgi:hypothetical protein
LLTASDPVSISYVLAASNIATIVGSSSRGELVWELAVATGNPKAIVNAAMTPYLCMLRLREIIRNLQERPKG